jgi:hypothetical protein
MEEEEEERKVPKMCMCVCVPGKWGGRERIQKHGAQLPDVEYNKHTHLTD